MAKPLQIVRWTLPRRGGRVRGRGRPQLESLLPSRLATARGWNLKEAIQQSGRYCSVPYAWGFRGYWCWRPMRGRIEPIKRIARTPHAPEELLLHCLQARAGISSGAVEGFNNTIGVLTRRSYGLRTYRGMELTLYHNLGRLSEPPVTH